MVMCDIVKIVKILKKEVKSYNVPIVDLIKVKTNDPFKILIATILSARTNDKTTSEVCSKLFLKVRKFEDLEKLTIIQIEKVIYPVGFYKNKAKQLKKLPNVIFKEFNGKIPHKIDDLIKLPGVGRKTANLVGATAFGKNYLSVDTHCHRIPNRWGVIKTKTPLETEIALKKILPKKYWKHFNRIVVAFGQQVCRPINPKCSKCPVIKYCDYYKKVYLKKK